MEFKDYDEVTNENKLVAMQALIEMIAEYGGTITFKVEFDHPVHVDEFERSYIGDGFLKDYDCNGVFDITNGDCMMNEEDEFLMVDGQFHVDKRDI